MKHLKSPSTSSNRSSSSSLARSTLLCASTLVFKQLVRHVHGPRCAGTTEAALGSSKAAASTFVPGIAVHSRPPYRSGSIRSLPASSLQFLSLSLPRPHLVNNEECVLHHGCACSLESTECVTELRPKYLYKRFWGAPPKASGFSRNSRHPRLGRFGEFEMVLDTTRGGEEELRAPRRPVQNPG